MTDVHGQTPERQTPAMRQMAETADTAETAGAADDELARRAQQGDRAAFAVLYRRHLQRVYRYLLARLGDEHLAQDVTAQSFLAALESLPHYRGQGAFAAWLLGIARNKAADALRGRRVMLPLEAAAHVESSAPAPERIIASRLALEAVVRALGGLAPERAEALTLRIFGQLEVSEVSAVMGKSEAAVKMLVHRAIQDLRVRLGRGSEAEP
jgi:RNA polymerase sigma-70 factor, ECF subfamily